MKELSTSLRIGQLIISPKNQDDMETDNEDAIKDSFKEFVEGGRKVKCIVCNGHGTISHPQPDGWINLSICSFCEGTGEIKQ